MLRNFNLINLLYMLPAIALAFTVHEFAHARVAVRAGDDTPKATGRYTLNPLRHISWIGLIMLIFAGFGWAKPVLINRDKLRNPKTDSVLISLAGPLSNLVAAFFFCFLYKLVVILKIPHSSGVSIYMFLGYLIQFNAILFIFNMLPIPPLDGSHILVELLPDSLNTVKHYYLRYGNFLLLLLIMLQVSGINVFGSLLYKTVNGITRIFGL